MTHQLRHPELPDQPFELRCHRCKALLASGMVALRDIGQTRDVDGKPLLPANRCMPSEVMIDGEVFYNTQPGELLIDTEELSNVSAGHGGWQGCCGPDGSFGPTLRCRNGHHIGTEVGDCWQPHFARLSRRWVEVCLPEWDVSEGNE